MPMSERSPKQQTDSLLSKTGIRKAISWAGGGLLLTIFGNLVTKWMEEYNIIDLPNFFLSHVNWLPPASLMITSLILGLMAYFFVQKAEIECLRWHGFCVRLYSQVRSDHSELTNIIWDVNEEQKKLLYRNELDLLIYESGQALREYEKNKNGKS